MLTGRTELPSLGPSFEAVLCIHLPVQECQFLLQNLFQLLPQFGHPMVRTIVPVAVFQHQPQVRHNFSNAAVQVVIKLGPNWNTMNTKYTVSLVPHKNGSLFRWADHTPIVTYSLSPRLEHSTHHSSVLFNLTPYINIFMSFMLLC